MNGYKVFLSIFCLLLLNGIVLAQGRERFGFDASPKAAEPVSPLVVLFTQDFSSSTVVADYVSATPNNGQFNAIGTSGAGTVVSINSGTLQYTRMAANVGSFSRTTDFSPTPTALIYKVDVAISGNTVAQTTAAVFQVGSGFGTANAAETNANTYGRFGINFSATTGNFSIRDITNGTSSAEFSGTQTITWALNNSGSATTYTAPDASMESIANDTADLWVGNTRVLNDVAIQTTTQTMTDLKFAFTAGTGTINIDNILIETIPEPPSGIMQFSSATYSGSEGTTATITVSRTGDTSGTSTVQYSASGGTGTSGLCSILGRDYELASGTLTFNPTDTSKTFTVTLCNDFFSENPAETAGLSLSSPTGGTLGGQASATLNILDTASEFVNSSAITITNGTTGSPYPSTVIVSGYTGTVAGVRVTLNGVTHSNPDDLDILLVSPGGQSFVLMADTGGSNALSNATITMEDAATVSLPGTSAITDGQNYKPASCGSVTFPSPAPAAGYALPSCANPVSPIGAPTLANTFGGSNPNGTWNLYVVDDGGSFNPLGVGQIGGWGLQFLAPTAANVTVSGRIMTANGAGIKNAIITVTGMNLIQQQSVQTGQFGYYKLRNLEAGQSYIISVATKRYRIAQPTRVIVLQDDLTDIDFVAEPQE